MLGCTPPTVQPKPRCTQALRARVSHVCYLLRLTAHSLLVLKYWLGVVPHELEVSNCFIAAHVMLHAVVTGADFSHCLTQDVLCTQRRGTPCNWLQAACKHPDRHARSQ